VAVYTGEVDYFSQQPELHLLNHTLFTDRTLRTGRGAVTFWFDKFISWMNFTTERSTYLEWVDFNRATLTFPTHRETQLAIQRAQLGPLPIIVNSNQFYFFLCEFLNNPISAEVTSDIVKTIKEEFSSCGNCCVLVSDNFTLCVCM